MPRNSRLSATPNKVDWLVIAVHRIDRHLRRFLVAVMLLLALGAGIGVERFVLESAPAGAQRDEDLADLEKYAILEEAYDVIREEYVLSDEITDQQLIYGAATGMVDALGDENHSVFLDPETAERHVESLEGELVGIGIQVNTEVSPPTVVLPIQNSPAFEAGILQGDAILAVDGATIELVDDPEALVDLIRGEEGTDVVLELRHEGESDSYSVTLTRTRIQVDPVSWAMLPNDVLWVRLSDFSVGATEGLAAALVAGKEQGAQGVILDLRANSGGFVYEALGVSSHLQPDGSVMVQTEDSAGEIVVTSTVGDNGEWQEGPLVVLIDENSVSAPEVVSASIQQNGRALLIGQTTFGTGTTINGIELSDGSMVNIGISLWRTPDGDLLWHRGVDPDIEVANEPGVQVTLPYTYEANEMSDEQFGALEDDQLLTAFDEVSDLIRSGSD